LQFDIETLEQRVPFTDLVRAKGKLRDVCEQVGTLANDLRRVAHGLHPSSLDHLGLTIALRSYAEEFSRSTAIPVQFTSRKVPRKVPAEVAICFYRIVQEALRNVGKHARTAAVKITLAGSSTRLHLSIRDNGEGFDMALARAQGGLGLISMQERVRLVQGQFSVQTQPGHGVHLSVIVPLPREPM
jgi:two-component system, NarL family, sensor kinase